MLDISVADGPSGPGMTLSGEADLTTTAELGCALAAQVSGATRYLTVDISRLRFADSASVMALARVSRTLRERGGILVLVRPQPAVARVINLLGVEQELVAQARAGPTGPGKAAEDLSAAANVVGPPPACIRVHALADPAWIASRRGSMPQSRRYEPAGELPGTLRPSSREAQDTFTEALGSAILMCGKGDNALRAAYTALKKKFEKRGNEWIPEAAQQ